MKFNLRDARLIAENAPKITNYKHAEEYILPARYLLDACAVIESMEYRVEKAYALKKIMDIWAKHGYPHTPLAEIPEYTAFSYAMELGGLANET